MVNFFPTAMLSLVTFWRGRGTFLLIDFLYVLLMCFQDVAVESLMDAIVAEMKDAHSKYMVSTVCIAYKDIV